MPTLCGQCIWQVSCYKTKTVIKQGHTEVCLNSLNYYIILTEVLDTHILIPRRVTSEKSLVS